MALNDVNISTQVDVAQSLPIPVVFAKQNDNNKRSVVVKLLQNGQPFTVGTGINGYIQGATAENPKTKKRLKFKYNLDSIDTSDGSVRFIVTRTMVAEIGITECEIALFGTDKPEDILCTANINLQVQGTGMSAEDEMASDDYKAITTILAEVTTMRNEVNTKTTQAIAAQGAAEIAAQNAYNSALGVQKIVAGNEAYTKQETDLKYSIAPRKEAKSATGELKLTDADDGLSYIELEGNSKQYANTANKNLIDLEYQKLYGINENRYLNVNGVIITPTTDKDWKISYYIKVKPNTVYVFTNLPTSLVACTVFYTKDKTFISSITNANIITNANKITTPSNCEYIRVTYRTLIEDTLQLEEGGTATEYVKGSIDTPSPDYPSEIKSVGDIPKDINGVEIRNLLDGDWIKNQPLESWESGTNQSYGINISSMIPQNKRINLGCLAEVVNDVNLKQGLDSQVYISNQVTGGSNRLVTFIVGNKTSNVTSPDLTPYDSIYFVIWLNNNIMSKEEVISYYINNFRFMISYVDVKEIDEYRPYIGENNGLVKLESIGKNLFPGKGIVIGHIGQEGVPGGNTRILRTDFIKIDNNKQYVFNPGTYNPYVFLYDNNQKFIKQVVGSVSKFNSENADYVILQFNSNPTAEQTQDDIDKMNKTLQLEEGTQSTEYQQYHQQITWIPLREPLRKIADYADTIDKDGNVTQEIASENFPKGTIWSEQLSTAWSTPRRGIPFDTTSSKVQSEISKNVSTGGSFLNDYYSRETLGKTLQEMNDFSESNEFRVYYVLNTPITYQIPAVYIETYQQETNIRCLNEVKPSSMNIDYKIAINSLIKRLEALETTTVQEVTK